MISWHACQEDAHPPACLPRQPAATCLFTCLPVLAAMNTCVPNVVMPLTAGQASKHVRRRFYVSWPDVLPRPLECSKMYRLVAASLLQLPACRKVRHVCVLHDVSVACAFPSFQTAGAAVRSACQCAITGWCVDVMHIYACSRRSSPAGPGQIVDTC